MRSVVVGSLVLLSLSGLARAQEPARTEPPPLAAGHWALRSRIERRSDGGPRSHLTTLTVIERRRGELWAVSRRWPKVREEPPLRGPGEATRLDAPAPADQVKEGEETLWLEGVALPCVRSAARAPDGSTSREWRCPRVPGGLVRAHELDPKGELTAYTELFALGPWKVAFGLRAAPGQWTLHEETSWMRRSGACVRVRRWVEERGGRLWEFEQEVDEQGAPLDDALAWESIGRLPTQGLAQPAIVDWRGTHLRCRRVVRNGDEANFLVLSDAVPLEGVVEERAPAGDRSTLLDWGVDGPRSTSAPLAPPEVAHDVHDLIRRLGEKGLLDEVSYLVRRGGSVRVERGKLLVVETRLGQERLRERLQELRAP